MFEYVKNYYKKILPEAEIQIGTDDSGKDKFCKSRAVNNAAKAAQGDIFIIADIDFIVDEYSIKVGVSKLSEHGWIIPYDSLCRLTEKETNKFFETGNLIASSYIRKIKNSRTGGIQIVSKEVFNLVQGYDEKFCGWGDEEICFLMAIETLYKPGTCLKGNGYHLYHAPQEDRIARSKKVNQDILRENSNYQLRQQYENCLLNKTKMLKLLGKDSPKVDFYAAEEHYFHHMLPIWEKLPEIYKNSFYVSDNIYDMFANDYDIHLYKDDIYHLVVPSLFSVSHILRKNLILMQHGAGQSFIKENGERGGAGGSNRERVQMFLDPNEYSSNLNKKKYPNATHKIIGCPKMDKWDQKRMLGQIKPRDKVPVIAISFHFDRAEAPEAKSAWNYYKSCLSMLSYKEASGEWKILGHGHPRMINNLIPEYQKNNIEVVKNFDEIMERADLYIMDHMSTLYEFASTDRPVVVLNAPWYRKEIEHGLRFWEYSDVGINCWLPRKLEKCIYEALEDNLEQKMKRERACNAVYAYRDGMCTDRAVNAIVDFLKSDFAAKPFERKLEQSKEGRSNADRFFGRR